MTKQETFLKTNKLSVLLSMALDDFELARKDPNYKIKMSTWHNKEDELANCVLAKTFKFHRESIYDGVEDLVKQEIVNKLWAIDSIRRGELRQALWHLNLNEEAKAIGEILNIANDDMEFSLCEVELILGESEESFEALRDCNNFKDFVTFYRRIVGNLKMAGL